METQKDTLNAKSHNDEVAPETSSEFKKKPFWQRIIEIGAQVPKEEWDKLPRDFCRNFEHYMYGAPKEEEWGVYSLLPMTCGKIQA